MEMRLLVEKLEAEIRQEAASTKARAKPRTESRKGGEGEGGGASGGTEIGTEWGEATALLEDASADIRAPLKAQTNIFRGIRFVDSGTAMRNKVRFDQYI